MVFLIGKCEFVDQLLEVFHVLNDRNPGARVIVLVSPADFVGQLLEFLYDSGWVSMDNLMGFLFARRRTQGEQ